MLPPGWFCVASHGSPTLTHAYTITMVAQPHAARGASPSPPPPAAACPTLVVAGTTPGAGATTLTAGLAAALRSRGLTVQAFVTGAGAWGVQGVGATAHRIFARDGETKKKKRGMGGSLRARCAARRRQ